MPDTHRKQWTMWNMELGTLTVTTPDEYNFEFVIQGVESIGEAVEKLGDAGYIVVTDWRSSTISDVHMVCMSIRDGGE